MRNKLNTFYRQAYDRVVDTLVCGGCEFTSAVSIQETKEDKVFPRDFDITLSLYDKLTLAPTKTKVGFIHVLSHRDDDCCVCFSRKGK